MNIRKTRAKIELEGKKTDERGEMLCIPCKEGRRWRCAARKRETCEVNMLGISGKQANDGVIRHEYKLKICKGRETQGISGENMMQLSGKKRVKDICRGGDAWHTGKRRAKI